MCCDQPAFLTKLKQVPAAKLAFMKYFLLQLLIFCRRRRYHHHYSTIALYLTLIMLEEYYNL